MAGARTRHRRANHIFLQKHRHTLRLHSSQQLLHSLLGEPCEAGYVGYGHSGLEHVAHHFVLLLFLAGFHASFAALGEAFITSVLLGVLEHVAQVAVSLLARQVVAVLTGGG